MKTLNMKTIYSTILLLLFVGPIFGQVDRTEPPKPGPAPEFEFESPSSFTMDNGLEVIVSENHEMPLVSFKLAVDVDPVKEKEAVGFVDAASNLLRNGTVNHEKSEIDESIDFIGASLYTFENGMYANCLSKHTDKLLDVMSDVVMNPTFPKEEVEKYKKQSKSELASSKTNASFIAQRVARKLRNGDHPYGELKTEKTIDKINPSLCKDYHGTYYKPNVSYLVMVGDITTDEAKKYAEKYFGDWNKSEVPEHSYDFPERNKVRSFSTVRNSFLWAACKIEAFSSAFLPEISWARFWFLSWRISCSCFRVWCS